jgi:hypothetical protein
MLIHVYCFQHEAGRKSYDEALEKIRETKLKIKEKEADLVRLTTELANSQTSLKSVKEDEQVPNDIIDKIFLFYWRFEWEADLYLIQSLLLDISSQSRSSKGVLPLLSSL